jgi:hypothetical protein
MKPAAPISEAQEPVARGRGLAVDSRGRSNKHFVPRQLGAPVRFPSPALKGNLSPSEGERAGVSGAGVPPANYGRLARKS